jgi:hypothetical protein
LRLSHVWQQDHLAHPFDRDRDLLLVSPAGAGVAAAPISLQISVYLGADRVSEPYGPLNVSKSSS